VCGTGFARCSDSLYWLLGWTGTTTACSGHDWAGRMHCMGLLESLLWAAWLGRSYALHGPAGVLAVGRVARSITGQWHGQPRGCSLHVQTGRTPVTEEFRTLHLHNHAHTFIE
jgi:hypothetical protein